MNEIVVWRWWVIVMTIVLLLLHPIQSFSIMSLDRYSFLQSTTMTLIVTSTSILQKNPLLNPTTTNNNNNDALNVLLTQRIALDNIAMVITNGNLEEAQFKSKQLLDQTRMAGTTYFQQVSSYTNNNNNKNSSILQLRLLSYQSKFVTVLDLCDDIQTSLKIALQKSTFTTTTTKSNTATTAAMTPYQLKCLRIIKDTQNAYDDYLLDIQYIKNELH